jgi:hypothetical protein
MKIVAAAGKKRLVIAWGELKTAGAGIQSVIVKNQYGREFFTLYGNTYEVKETLKQFGFKFFKGTWGKPADAISPADRTKLQELGVDLSPLDTPATPQQPEGAGTDPLVQTVPEVEETAVDKQLSEMKAGIDSAMKEHGSKDRVKALFTFIEESIDKVANLADEAAKSEFVKSFLAFAAKFHNYSFSNQMLIWVQDPKATYVKGFKQWNDLGRRVTDFNKRIVITAPFTSKRHYTEKELQGLTPEEIENLPKTFMRFAPVDVYDVANTQVIEGWEERTGKKPFEPASWRGDSNESTEEITALVNALKDWAVDNKIDVGSEEMEQALGGYSAGGKIRINDKYEGVNLFSTFVHECAHEILHWIETKTGKERPDKAEGRKEKEIDAETTAYIVLAHYGFETKDTPNYLALWRAGGKDVKSRRDSISKAVKTIVEGIDKNMAKTVHETEDVPEAAPETVLEQEQVNASSHALARTATGKVRLVLKAAQLR